MVILNFVFSGLASALIAYLIARSFLVRSAPGLRQVADFGLLSIRERIELLRGRTRIKSAPGHGSTFLVVLPDSETGGAGSETQTAMIGPAADGGRSAKKSGRRLRVLLADDHKIVREGLRLLLREERDTEIVGEAVHGREAVDLALRLEPDVVSMDVSMPLINGDEATRLIKEHLPKTRVVALSTYSEPERIRKMYGAGAEGLMVELDVVEGLKVPQLTRSPIPSNVRAPPMMPSAGSQVGLP